MIGMLPDDFCAAEFSPCRTWRYVLRRRWAKGSSVGFVLLNPSTADERSDDPTIRRCIAYAKSWGFSGMSLGNIFAFRATDPRIMRAAPDPIGPANDEALISIADEAHGVVICGWGRHGAFLDRGHHVVAMLRAAGVSIKALRITAGGHPGHPLYLPAALTPIDLLRMR